jgi:anti-sigma B factor antagonist
MQKDDPLQVTGRDGAAPGTRILEFSGPITLPNLFAFQDAVRSGPAPSISILDLSQVPYVDSAGMGAIINYFTHCQRNRVRLLVAGVTPRVSELFRMTGVQTIISMPPTVADAEALI